MSTTTGDDTRQGPAKADAHHRPILSMMHHNRAGTSGRTRHRRPGHRTHGDNQAGFTMCAPSAAGPSPSRVPFGLPSPLEGGITLHPWGCLSRRQPHDGDGRPHPAAMVLPVSSKAAHPPVKHQGKAFEVDWAAGMYDMHTIRTFRGHRRRLFPGNGARAGAWTVK